MGRGRKTQFKFEFEGLKEYNKKMMKVGENSHGMAKRALYDGAHVAGEAIIANIKALPYHPTKGISHAQKEGLLEGFGYSKMKYKKSSSSGRKGVWSVKLGFEGYNSVKTKKYPNGQPNAMIAAAINSGTSRRRKTNFIYKAVNKKARPAIVAAMESRFDEDMKKLMDEE